MLELEPPRKGPAAARDLSVGKKGLQGHPGNASAPEQAEKTEREINPL